MLDMQVTSITEHKEHVMNSDLLPIAVIYGPNGGGKSNVLRALNLLCRMIAFPVKSLTKSIENMADNELPAFFQDIIAEPFKFDADTRDNPTVFKLFIQVKDKEYKYTISVFGDKVLSESLYALDKDATEQRLIYDCCEKRYNLSDEIHISDMEIKELNNKIPLISYLAITRKNAEDIKNVADWFVSKFVYINSTGLDYNKNRKDSFVSKFIEKNREAFVKVFNEMDIDIVDLMVQKSNERETIEYYTKHSILNNEFKLNLREESNGTQKLFLLIPRILHSLSNGRICVIDELDSQLHPKLLEYIINLFTDPVINSNKAQLIFTSHDLSTMNNDIFRRDEIWFAAKNNEQATALYSLVEIKNEKGKSTRKDAAFNKQYFEGKYGADPYLRRIIDWEVEKIYV